MSLSRVKLSHSHVGRIKLAYILAEGLCKCLGTNKDFYNIFGCSYVCMYINTYILLTKLGYSDFYLRRLEMKVII